MPNTQTNLPVIPAYEKAFKGHDADGHPLYMLWDVLSIAGKRHDVDFWDYLLSDKDFDKWCDSKGYGKRDPQGEKRSQSRMWFAEQEKEIAAKKWNRPEHLSFVSLLTDHYFTNMIMPDDESWEDEIITSDLLYLANRHDARYFGKPGWRVALATILAEELGEGIRVVAS